MQLATAKILNLVRDSLIWMGMDTFPCLLVRIEPVKWAKGLKFDLNLIFLLDKFSLFSLTAGFSCSSSACSAVYSGSIACGLKGIWAIYSTSQYSSTGSFGFEDLGNFGTFGSDIANPPAFFFLQSDA